MENPVIKITFSNRLFYLNRILIFLFLYLAFGFFMVKAAVAVDNSSSQGAFSITGVPDITWSHTVGNGISRALYVGVTTTSREILSPVCPFLPCSDLPPLPNSNTFRVISVTSNSVALERVGGIVSSNLNNTVEIYRLVNPAVGANTIVVTLTPGTSTHVVGGAVSFTGVNQTNPNGNFTSNIGTNAFPTVTIDNTNTDDVVFDVLGVSPNAGSFAPSINQTLRWEGSPFFSNAYDVGAGSTKSNESSPVTMSWTMTGVENWAIAGVAIKAVPASSASGVIQGRVFSGDGRNVSKAIVTITGNGETFTAMTNPFGYFRFNEIPFGDTYIVQVRSKQYVFAPQVITFNEDINNLNLTATGK